MRTIWLPTHPTDTRRARQVSTLRVIVRLTAERGFCPTLQEIGNELGLVAKSAVRSRIKTLEELGLVTQEPGLARTLRVTAAGAEMAGLQAKAAEAA